MTATTRRSTPRRREQRRSRSAGGRRRCGTNTARDSESCDTIYRRNGRNERSLKQRLSKRKVLARYPHRKRRRGSRSNLGFLKRTRRNMSTAAQATAATPTTATYATASTAAFTADENLLTSARLVLSTSGGGRQRACRRCRRRAGAQRQRRWLREGQPLKTIYPVAPERGQGRYPRSGGGG